MLEGAAWRWTIAFLWQSGGEAVGHPASRVQCISWQAGECWVCCWSWYDQTWFCLRDPGRLSRQARMSFLQLEQQKLENKYISRTLIWKVIYTQKFSFPNFFSWTLSFAFLMLQRQNGLEREYQHLTASSWSEGLSPLERRTWLQPLSCLRRIG